MSVKQDAEILSPAVMERYATLIRISQAIGLHQDPKELFEALTNELRRVVPFDYIGVSLRHQNSANFQDPFINMESRCALPDENLALEERLTSWAYEHQQPLLTLTDEPDSHYQSAHAILKRYGVRSTCTLPLTTVHRRLGAISFGSKGPQTYSPDEVRFASLVADQIALAFANALNFIDLQKASEELQKKNERLQLLIGLTNQLVSNLELPDLLRTIATSVRRVLHCDTVGVALPDDRKGELRLQILDFPASNGFVREGMILGPESDAGTVFRTAKPLLIKGANLSESVRPNSWVMENLACGCLLPLLGRGGVLGVLGVARRTKEPFSQGELDVVAQVANQIALAVENALAYGRIKDLKEQLSNEKVYLEDEIRAGMNFAQIVGNSSALRKVLKRVQTVAPTASTVLICGETGTGKELIARAVHELSPRAPKAFVKLNCAAIPTGLLESELFGHERGAFTGAVAQRIGRFEIANGGTIFLDEVGEIPLELQTKLLRVLQEREFERLGSSRTLRTDARLIAATNRDLEVMMNEQKFRPDLFFRLNVFPIRVVPLRERQEDIPELVRHFARQFSRRLNKAIDTVPSAIMDALCHYHWPGNIRELQNVIERAVILSKGTALRVDVADLKPPATRYSGRPPSSSSSLGGTIRSVLQETERQHILDALKQCNWIVAGRRGAAARLGMNRSTLQLRMQKLGIFRSSH
jgi:formate hydrogenlyase transcriptional activator